MTMICPTCDAGDPTSVIRFEDCECKPAPRPAPPAIVAECWTCACDGPPACTMPHSEGDHGRMPYRLTAYRMKLHVGHDVREVKG